MPFMRGKIATAYQYGGRKPTFFSSETFSNSAYGRERGNLGTPGGGNGAEYMDTLEQDTGTSASANPQGVMEQPHRQVPSTSHSHRKKSPSPPPILREEFSLKI